MAELSGSVTTTLVLEKATESASVTVTAPPVTVSTGTSFTGLTARLSVLLEPVLRVYVMVGTLPLQSCAGVKV